MNSFGEEPIHPTIIVKCLKDPKTFNLKVLTFNNPYYLRGDFDDDGESDYALEVRSKVSEKNGMLICSGNGSVYLLGSGIGGKQFSDMDNDNFLSNYWEVMSQKQVHELKAFRGNVPYPIPHFKGEAIGIIWEACVSMIYWNGEEYKWLGCEGDSPSEVVEKPNQPRSPE